MALRSASRAGWEQTRLDRREGRQCGKMGQEVRYLLCTQQVCVGCSDVGLAFRGPHSQATSPKGTTEQREWAEKKWFGDPEKRGRGGRPAVWGPRGRVQTGFGEEGRRAA